MVTKKKTDETEAVVDAPAETEAVETSEVKADAAEAVETSEVNAAATEEAPKKSAKAPVKKAEVEAAATSGDATDEPVKKGKRAEKIGVVTSDKMTLTVVVRVDRLVKHPIYRKYIRKRKKFMAHDDKGAKIGDKVRIVETRPLSARKRWRVVEIIHKAEL